MDVKAGQRGVSPRPLPSLVPREVAQEPPSLASVLPLPEELQATRTSPRRPAPRLEAWPPRTHPGPRGHQSEGGRVREPRRCRAPGQRGARRAPAGVGAPPRPAPPLARAAFKWIKAGKMTSLLTERYTETSLVIYWLSAPD